MPRQADNTELARRLVGIELVLPQTTTPFDQLSTVAANRGVNAITVPVTTNATAADTVFIIGSNGTELNKLGTPATTMPLVYKTEFQHPIGARVLEGVVIPLGRIEQNGFSLSPSQQETLIEAADSETAVQTIRGTLELAWSFGTLGYNNLNLLNAFGYESNEQGVGTAVDPYQASIGGIGQTLLGIAALRINLTRFDSKLVSLDLTNCSFVPQGTIQIGAKNSATSIGWSGKSSQIIQRIWTP